MADERVLILEMLKEGKISVEEAEKLLAALDVKKSRGESKHTHQGGEGRKVRDPWSELGDMWEKLGSDMEHFWKEFGDSIKGQFGHKWARKMEHWAENFGETMKNVSQDWSDIAGEAARNFFDSLGVESGVFVGFDARRVVVEEQFDWEQEVEQLEGVVINNLRGSVTVDGVSENKVTLSVQMVVKAETEEKGRAILSQMTISTEIQDGILRIMPVKKTDMPINTAGIPVRSASFHFTLKVPRSVKVSVKQIKGDATLNDIQAGIVISIQKGDVTFRQIRGEQRIQLTKGDVSCARGEGNLAVQIAKGDIDCTDHEGDIALNLMKGDIAIDRVQGKLKGKVALGDVSAKEVDGDISLMITKGDIDLEVKESKKVELSATHGDQSVNFQPINQGNYTFQAHHGDIDLNLGSEPSASFEIRVANGDIDTNLFEIENGHSPHSYSETIGQGTANVKIDMLKGDLSLYAEKVEEVAATEQEDSDPGAPEEQQDKDEAQTEPEE